MTFAFTKTNWNNEDYRRIDVRFLPYLDDWKIVQHYKGKIVTMPGTWNAEIWPFNYYEVVKVEGDPNRNVEENEKELSLACGWKDNVGMYDREVQINLRLEGKQVLELNDVRVRAEIIKCGGAPMKVYFNNYLITDFYDHIWWSKSKNGYQTISDMSIYL